MSRHADQIATLSDNWSEIPQPISVDGGETFPEENARPPRAQRSLAVERLAIGTDGKVRWARSVAAITRGGGAGAGHRRVLDRNRPCDEQSGASPQTCAFLVKHRKYSNNSTADQKTKITGTVRPGRRWGSQAKAAASGQSHASCCGTEGPPNLKARPEAGRG